MLTFEEFFKKKKINLAALQDAEPGLFAEFENHYGQMGEKSFDHTKKYWFNKLRLKYHLAPEIKVEKVVIENRLAEQTIVDSLTEPVTSAPKTGFTPRFKAPSTPKPAEDTHQAETPAEQPAATPPPAKVGFTPRFKAAPKPAEDTPQAETAAEQTAATPPPAKVGFTPRFKAAPKPAEDTPQAETPTEQPAATPPPAKVGFTPRFKAVPKPAEDTPQAEPPTEQPAATPPPAKVGFTPRFKAAPKPAEDIPQSETPAVEPPAESIEPPVEAKPALGFKPKFRAASTPKPAEEKPAPEKEDVIKDEAPDNTIQVNAAAAAEETPEEKPVTTAPLGFKPKFRAATDAPKPVEEITVPEIQEPIKDAAEPATASDVAPEEKPAEETPSPKPALGFKPRFNAKTTPPKPPQE